MKQKNIVTLLTIFVMFILVTLCMVKISNVQRQLSKLEIERQHSGNMPIHTTSGSTLPFKAKETNVTIADIAQEQFQANNQLDPFTGSENSTPELVCISQWLQDALTVNEMLRCVEDYANKMNG